MTTYELTQDQIDMAVRWRDSGSSAEQVAELCSAAGWSPVATIKVLKKYFEVSLGEGKTMVDGLQDSETRKANDYLRYQAELVLRCPQDATDTDLESMESTTGWSMKLWALVQAGRYEDIESALDRFDPQTMTFPAMTMIAARNMVLAVISRWPIEMEILDEWTGHHDFGWTFSAQSSKFIHTQDMLDIAVGHGPFLVDKFTGVLWQTGSAFPTETCVANYQATGDPSRSKAA